jgi:hypothetical protein
MSEMTEMMEDLMDKYSQVSWALDRFEKSTCKADKDFYIAEAQRLSAKVERIANRMKSI